MAKDIIHQQVKNALIKDGWTITDDPFRVEFEELEIFADLAAERGPIVARKHGQKIIAEIKTFAGRSFIREFQQALGQYDLYLEMLDLAGFEHELYLAISEFVYEEYFQRKGTAIIVQRKHLKIFVVNLKQEEIVTWIK